MSSSHAHRKRSRSCERVSDLERDLSDARTALDRLHHEKRQLVQQLTETRAHLRHAITANEHLEMDVELADVRIRDLEVALLDARDSNDQHAMASQDLLVRCMRAEGVAASLQTELIQGIQGHALEMARLMDHHQRAVHSSERDTLTPPSCQLCCDTTDGDFVVLGCCHQVVCMGCRGRLRSCPYCRDALCEDHDTVFGAWWSTAPPAEDLC